MFLYCWYCHKPVTNWIPDATIFRATATCPECEEKLPDVEQLQAQVEELTEKLKALTYDALSEHGQ